MKTLYIKQYLVAVLLLIISFSCDLFCMNDDDSLSIGGLFDSYESSEDTSFLLHDAVSKGEAETVRNYLENKIFDVNEWNVYGETCLQVASFLKDVNQRQEIVKLLLENKADPNKKDNIFEKQNTALHYFFKQGCEREVKLLLQHNANIELQDSEGNTVFHKIADLYFMSEDTRNFLKCFERSLLQLKTFLLHKKRIENVLKTKFPRPLIYVIGELVDPTWKIFLNSAFNNSLLKKNNKNKTAYDILHKKYESDQKYQSYIKLFKPVEIEKNN